MENTSIFNDKRLDKEYDGLVSQMVTHGSAVINRACVRPSEKKSAYRFINNKKVTVAKIAQDMVNQMVGNVNSLG